MLRKATPERVSLFSDGVFAVPITVLGAGTAAARNPYLRGAAGVAAPLAQLCTHPRTDQWQFRNAARGPTGDASAVLDHPGVVGAAAVIALWSALAGLGICITCLVLYLRPHRLRISD